MIGGLHRARLPLHFAFPVTIIFLVGSVYAQVGALPEIKPEFAGFSTERLKRLEASLQKVEDILAIQQTLGDYITYMDASDYAAYSELFALDGELIFQAYRLKGPKAIRDMMEKGSRSAGTAKSSAPTGGLRHMMSNVVILVDGDKATSTARWIVMSQGADGRPILGATGHYEDSLRKEGAQWKFQRRVIYTDFPYQNPLAAK